MRFSVGAASDVGRRREINEDCALVSERVVAVADGMGGHEGGEIASEVAVDALRAAMSDPDVSSLAEAVAAANAAVWDRAADANLRGMGTTLCALALLPGAEDEDDRYLALTNVGDSRVYVLVDGELERLTEDHSLVEGLVREGRITSEEAEVHPHRNVVTRVLGIGETVEIDSWELEARTGDRYLLCSDGLFNEVEESRIAATLRRLADPQEAAHDLVAQANQAGGRDNITVVVVDLVDDGGEIAEAFGDRVVRPRRSTVGDLAGFTAVVAPASARRSRDGRDEGAARTGGDDDEEDARARSLLPPADAEPAEERPRRFTWRSGVFVLALLAVLGVAAGAVAWYGTSGYFVSVDDDGEIAVFEGRPGGLLWFQPSVVESTGVDISDLTPVLRERVESEPEFSSFADAEAYLANLADQLDRAGRGSRSAASTTTTRPTTTTSTTSTTSPAPVLGGGAGMGGAAGTDGAAGADGAAAEGG